MIDCHTHTNVSYCAEKPLILEVYADLVKNNPEVDAVYVTDHGMAVYFPYEMAWSWQYITDSRIFDEHKEWGNNRLEMHLANIAKFRNKGVFPGLEVEMMHDGRLTIDNPFREKIDVLIGSVHYLPIDIEKDSRTILKDWKKHTKKLINSGIDVLGHPFRWINNQIPVTRAVVREIVKEAKRAGVAMELNGHCAVPTDVSMLEESVEHGVPISIGTDAHTISETGNFTYHLGTISQSGISLAEIKMFKPKRK